MIAKFFQSRGARRFRRNRIAMASLALILIYVAIALAIIVGDLLTLEDTMDRVGPANLPGSWGSQTTEKRFEDIDYYLRQVERALYRRQAGQIIPRRNPEEALKELRLGSLQAADHNPVATRKRVDEAVALFEELEEYEDLDAEPEVLPKLEELERLVAAFYRPAGAMGGFSRWLELSGGTDRQGRSIAIRAIYSIKVAIQVGLVTAFISILVGSLLGAAAGFYGGWIDHLVIWLYSTFSSIPNLVLLTLLAYMFTGSIFDGTLIPIYVAFCMTFWIGPCRVIRGETLKLRELEYVQAATAIGFGKFYILLRHILPNTAHLMFINFSLLFIGAIKSEVILSFLGLGVKKGPSWGIMISQSGQEVINGFFWQIGTATALMFGLVLAFNILTDALQDAFDPKHV